MLGFPKRWLLMVGVVSAGLVLWAAYEIRQALDDLLDWA